MEGLAVIGVVFGVAGVVVLVRLEKLTKPYKKNEFSKRITRKTNFEL